MVVAAEQQGSGVLEEKLKTMSFSGTVKLGKTITKTKQICGKILEKVDKNFCIGRWLFLCLVLKK